MRVKCKRCNKYITVSNETCEDISCPNCETLHAWLFDDGWGYHEKEYKRKKCPICKRYTFIRRDLLNNETLYFKISCACCKNELLIKNQYGKLVLFPYKYLYFSCEWCGEQLECDVENVCYEYLQKQENAIVKHIENCKCTKCNKKTKVCFHPAWDAHYTRKVLPVGRKRKLRRDEIEEFLNNDFLYKRYNLVHPNNIFDFCDNCHYDYEQVFEFIIDKGIEIFMPLSKQEMDALSVKKYEKYFNKLILKENAMTEAGGASLSKLLGQRKVWKKLRELMIIENDSICKICGSKIENPSALHIHENWVVDKNVINITFVELICAMCHACKHRNEFIAYRVMDGDSTLVNGIPRIDILTIHLMRVNNVPKEVIYAYRKKILEELAEYERMRRHALVFGGNEIDNNEIDSDYKYIIDKNIPLKDEIELVLKEKKLLL